MEDSAMDMESMGPLRPQTFLFGCELKAEKEYQFKVDDEENEHQLSLRTASSIRFVTLGAGAKDELHVVEAEALDYEGNPTKVVLASLKMSVQPTVSLGGFEITPPVVLRLKCGSGPVYVSGQHLVGTYGLIFKGICKTKGFVQLNEVDILNIAIILSALEEEPESEDEEEDTKVVNASTKRPASGGGAKTPQPAREPAGKNMQKAKQNGKDSKPSTPASKTKTPDSKKDKSLTPKTPKVPLSLEEIKAKMQASIDKGSSLPKLEPKFANYVKNCFRTEDQKVTEFIET
ncbi:hypothetical protein ASZ78_007386 [Callipepla squamata]|uniref:Nucleophosmin n=1 Tax=Callipepla squamata TaxID=9009 RepID=A0A226NBI6_CALSU|nr:hypothetical protein ASZ78_007386 [Callipepla squamata]